mgnify:FL=1
MENIRLVETSLNIVFSKGNSDDKAYKQEFMSLLMLYDDPLSLWLNSDKIRKQSQESDQVLLTLVAELHRKIDTLSMQLNNKNASHLQLEKKERINAIGFEYFGFEEACLVQGWTYYGRIDMPVFPRREVALFFEALSPYVAKITLMHEDDKKDWGAYMVACERAMIRRMKGREDEC